MLMYILFPEVYLPEVKPCTKCKGTDTVESKNKGDFEPYYCCTCDDFFTPTQIINTLETSDK